MSLLLWGTMLCCFAVSSCKDEVMPGYYTWTQEEVDTPLNNLNANIRAVKAIVEASHNNEGIRAIVPFNDGTGYSMDFSDGTYAAVLTTIATSGAEGLEEQYAPVVSVGKENDSYYWKLDGSFLINEDDAKYNVVGDVTPQLSVDANGCWVLARDSISSTTLQQRVDGIYTSLFSGVKVEEEQVTFSFSDGLSDITLPIREAGINQYTPTTRRIISNTQPTWMIFIDSPSTPDPQKIIDAIPDDIRPYVIFTIAMSINTTGTGLGDSKGWNSVEYGWDTAESWLRVCAQNKVWAMIQPASGGICHFEDYVNYEDMENSNFKRFYEEYPNFLGLNYCEQFWGFSDEYPLANRIAQWKNFVRLSHQYGGYCLVSFTAGYTAAGINPIYYIRDNPEFAAMLKLYPENFCIVEKFTSSIGVFDNESVCFGMWASGYAGHYGIRFDECGWAGHNGDTYGLPVAVGAIPVLEHGMLTGQTIQDGPETGLVQCYSEGSAKDAGDGYTGRTWAFKKQFRAVNEDVFRQFISGMVPIPTRQEVIERTKVVMIQNITSGDSKYQYMSPRTLYTGLYKMPDDGIWDLNKNYFKRTGRYPSLPLVQDFADDIGNSFEYKVYCSEYEGMWGDEERKVADFNAIFPEEYTGTMFAGRYHNRWVVYCGDPDLNTASIPFQYNTCTRMDLEYSKYTSSVVREISGQLEFFMTNYDAGNLSNSNTSPKYNTIKIYGCSSEPSITFNKHDIVDWNDSKASISTTATYTASWDATNQVYTVEVGLNGSCDFTISCSGSNTSDRRTDIIAKQELTKPSEPVTYTGQLQYEAESFDYKNGVTIQKNGCKQEFRYYKGQGYTYFGNDVDAAIRYNKFNVSETNGGGTYTLTVRYRSSADVDNVHLWFNSVDMGVISLPATVQDDEVWGSVTATLKDVKGNEDNVIELKTVSGEAVSGTLVFDCVYLDFVSAN